MSNKKWQIRGKKGKPIKKSLGIRINENE